MVSGEHLFLGVDVGGTKVAAGLVNSAAEVMLTARMPMVTRKSAEDGLRAVLDAIDEVLSDQRAADVSAIGISVPGWVDSRQGLILNATNLPCWQNYSLADEIERRYKLPPRLANDAVSLP